MKKLWGWIWAAMKWVVKAPKKALGWAIQNRVWIIYEFSGIRAVYEHIKPPTDKEKEADDWRSAPTFTLWAAGIYTALFGLASARYENAVDRVETRAGAVVALLANDNVRKEALAQVASVQHRMVPKQPKYFDWPPFFFDSFVLEEPYEDGLEMLKTAVETCKRNLVGANLRGAYLKEAGLWAANLKEANLSEAMLWEAELGKANLSRAILHEAFMYGAELEKANLSRASLYKAIMYQAKLENANLSRANLNLASLEYANLKWADLSGARLVSAALDRANLEGANLENAILKGANLLGVNLEEIQNWKEIYSIKGANITLVRNAPDGFLDWALEQGAVINEDALRGINFADANLEGMTLQWLNLEGIQNWKEIKSIKGANITGVKNAPEGFIEWALENGAVIDDEPPKEDKPQ